MPKQNHFYDQQSLIARVGICATRYTAADEHYAAGRYPAARAELLDIRRLLKNWMDEIIGQMSEPAPADDLRSIDEGLQPGEARIDNLKADPEGSNPGESAR